MSTPVKKTRLHGWHVNHGANMAIFGAYDMPLWYPSGAKEEHLVVLTHAGIFDTSHMSVITVKGAGARDLLQVCFSKNLAACVGKDQKPLTPGRSVYGVFLNEAGEVIDDAIVFEAYDSLFMVVVNAGMGGVVSAHLQGYAGGRKAAVVDLSDQVGKLDVQGPQAARIISRIVKRPQEVFAQLPYFSFKGHFNAALPVSKNVVLTDGTPILLSRTGYTGEFGFELFVAPDKFVDLWQMLINVGQPMGMIPCGLAARDSLRTGAVLPLSHQDIGAWLFKNHPWPFALPYDDTGHGFTKDFVGAVALQRSDSGQYTFPFAGFDLRKVSTADPAAVVDDTQRDIGRVLTCATDMAIGRHEGRIFSIASPDKPADFTPRGLSCGFVKVTKPLMPGQIVRLKDKRRTVEVEIVDDIRPDRTARKPL
ncbi:MAG: aminomethyltransferase family protein, partial [Desulfobacterales bacterium]|nr:aminomethyltransferase family protein [Desulfobacterales bacterium]